MSIKKYTNIDGINSNTENEGKFIQLDDLFIISKNQQIEETDFGDCKYDVMEVSVYDINNNLLPNKFNEKVAYIRKGYIKEFMYKITNAGGQKEIAIDIEKLLNTFGFTNGILKVNLNFVRFRVGSNDEMKRVWIQEISPSREEIRILPLKTKDDNINNETTHEFNNLQNLNKDFKYYKKEFLDSLNSFENNFLDKIDSTIESQFGKDFFNIVKIDFGLSQFGNTKKQIMSDFKTSVTYYLTNKYYKIGEAGYGSNSAIRFEDCEQYDFGMLIDETLMILIDSINYNLRSLKRRDLGIQSIPSQFKIKELQKQIQNNLDAFVTPVTLKRNIFSPNKVNVIFNDNVDPILPPPMDIVAPIDPLPDEPVIIQPTPEPMKYPITESFDGTNLGADGGGGGGGWMGREDISRLENGNFGNHFANDSLMNAQQ